jgi:hypothetical protein
MTTSMAGNNTTEKQAPKKFKKCTGSRLGSGGRKPLFCGDVINLIKQFCDGKQ